MYILIIAGSALLVVLLNYIRCLGFPNHNDIYIVLEIVNLRYLNVLAINPENPNNRFNVFLLIRCTRCSAKATYNFNVGK
jgi:hypothetical protein